MTERLFQQPNFTNDIGISLLSLAQRLGHRDMHDLLKAKRDKQVADQDIEKVVR